MDARPKTSMKKGWLCRISYDEKNKEIAPMMMIQQRCSRTRDDPNRVMIQIQMKMTWRWRWLGDEGDLKMNMTWRWRWLDDDPDDTEKNTCADKLCQENTFLVKRECWCNCNFRMYSLVFLMYCTLMFIPGSVCNVIESCHTPMVIPGSFYTEKFMSSHCG